MQRTGRKGHAQFRVVVQDSRRTPTSGKLVASLGYYNPHSKEAVVDKDKASYYLQNGAQPSERVARLLKSEGVKLPKWVELTDSKKRSIKNTDKLRKNRPAEEKTEESTEETPKEEVAEAADEAPDKNTEDATEVADDKPSQEAESDK
ncbi:MAG: 30S ribosomal protein S16 [Candidatus Saccharibacteria bacterium]|nr:30S ribosomal protein S16 [Candidatus Saccharibacteria bacterium]